MGQLNCYALRFCDDLLAGSVKELHNAPDTGRVYFAFRGDLVVEDRQEAK